MKETSINIYETRDYSLFKPLWLRTIYVDNNGGEWVFVRPLPSEWGDKKAAFRSLADGVLDSEETEAVREGDDWTIDFFGETLRLTRTKRTFLDEGW